MQGLFLRFFLKYSIQITSQDNSIMIDCVYFRLTSRNQTTAMIRLHFSLLLLLSLTSTSFSQSKIALRVKGLSSNVEIIRDTWGVNHIYAKNEHDLFFHKDIVRQRTGSSNLKYGGGKPQVLLQRSMGPNELKRDIGTRLFKFRGDMQKELSHYHHMGLLSFRRM